MTNVVLIQMPLCCISLTTNIASKWTLILMTNNVLTQLPLSWISLTTNFAFEYFNPVNNVHYYAGAWDATDAWLCADICELLTGNINNCLGRDVGKWYKGINSILSAHLCCRYICSTCAFTHTNTWSICMSCISNNGASDTGIFRKPRKKRSLLQSK
jgi:hypothetical protein